MEQWTASKLGKEYIKALYCHSAYLTYIQSTSCKMLGWKKCKLELRSITSICRWHHPCGRKWRGTEEPLDESERGEWKSCLKLNFQKTKIMASGPITLCKEMSLILSTPFRFVIAFLPRSRHVSISWLQSPSTVILEHKKLKSVTVSIVSPPVHH